MLATCGYQRIDLHDGSHALLIAASSPPVTRERRIALTKSETEPAEPSSTAAVPPAPAPPPVTPAQPSEQVDAPEKFTLFDAFAEPPASTERLRQAEARPLPPPGVEWSLPGPCP